MGFGNGNADGAMMQWAAEAETCNYPIYKCEGDDDQPPPSSTHLPVAAIDHDHDHAADMP
uniref:Uncharacterized protein n=1 Tax=Oryza sativa subsp. japonica TaxID=39947 RepID=Q6ETU2_ORYSJ|nr:hypothetical protein [Oryza sativa Japonica Group]